VKEKVYELEPNSSNNNIRDLYCGINEFEKGYQPRTNLVKRENGDLLANSQMEEYLLSAVECKWY
jgi:hypothetical protein